MKKRRWFVETVIGLGMIPLSAVPLWFYVTHTGDGYLMYLRARYAISAPATARLPAWEYRWARAHHGAPERGVAVLLYHGIGRAGSDAAATRFVVPRNRFAEQMRALRAAGYRAITCRGLARYLRTGSRAALPAKPVLITFDDGRTDAMLQGDSILKDTGMRATMFVIGARTQQGSFYYVQLGALRKYARNGRWELENHTYNLHFAENIGRFTHSALLDIHPGESIDAYRKRIASDLDKDQRLLGNPIAFAYPYSDWGELARPAARRTLASLLHERFQVAFDQDFQREWRPALPGDDPLHIHRLEVADWTGAQLIARLEQRAAAKG